jgi:hypothetical protein
MKRLGVWQDRLELGDWKISIIMSRRSDLRPGTLGNIRWDMDDKTARIRVLGANEYQMPFEAAYQDMEFTLVHELIHLELASLPRNDSSRGDEEYAVNRMADALLQLDGGVGSVKFATADTKPANQPPHPTTAVRARDATR